MKTFPGKPNLEHLKKQAKESRQPGQKLSESQHELAREYGFRSWNDMRSFVDAINQDGFVKTFQYWISYVYGSGYHRPKPHVAERLLVENPKFRELAPYAAGDLEGIKRNPKATTDMPPLIAVSHSSLSRIRPADFEACATFLIEQGAEVNATRIDPRFPDSPLSVIYGAAGENHQPGLTKILLDAGANPNDNESVYHATETRDLTCLQLLLAAGATAKGTNALNRSLDEDHLACTQLLLDAGADPNEGNPALHWAIRRRRSLAHIEALLQAGANPTAVWQGVSPYRAALFFGLSDIASRLQALTGEAAGDGIDRFLAACAAADRETAQAMLRERDWISELPPAMLRLLPDMVEARNSSAVELMVELGWPIGVQGGDWQASALNLAVFRGDAGLAQFLLQHGASWEERHGFKDDVRGTLSFASIEGAVPDGDWVGCAKALVDAGMPNPLGDHEFSDDVTAYFDTIETEPKA